VFLWYDVARGAAFFLSIAFIGLRVILPIAARRMKPAQETEAAIEQVPARE